MNNHQDNGNKENQNIVILATFQNIKYYDFQVGSLCDGFLIISKDPASFYFRWVPYTSDRNFFSSGSEKHIQLINSIHLFRVVIETSYKHCEVSLYCVDHDEPTIFLTYENHINFSHELAQIFTINSVFLGDPNWAHLTHMFLKPPTADTGSIIYYLPCYNGKFSYPVFLTSQFFQKFKKNIEKPNKDKEDGDDNAKKSENQSSLSLIQTNNETNNRVNPLKSFFNFSKFSSSPSVAPKITPTDANSSNNSFLSNFSQIFSKYKIKNTNLQLPMTKSDFMLLNSQNVSISEIKKMIAYQGMDEELRREMWPIFLSILPNQDASLKIEEGENTYQKVLRLRVQEYKALKFQWKTMTHYQLSELKKTRSAFYTIKMDVKRTTVPDELLSRLTKTDTTAVKKARLLFQKVLKNVLKTFAVWNTKIKYTQGINEIAVPFVCLALYEIINSVIDKCEENNGLTENLSSFEGIFLNGNLVDPEKDEFGFEKLIEEREAIAFWCFVSFQEKSQNVLLETSMTNLIETDLPEILEIVKKQSNRDVFKFIKQYNLDSLNFLVSPVMLIFRRSFSEAKVERLWDTIIVLEKVGPNSNFETFSLVRKKNFQLAFAASVLIFSVPLLRKKLAGDQTGSIEQNCETLMIELPEIIESLPIEYVIKVALSIENDLSTKNQPRIVNNLQDSVENEFFSPAMLSETNEYARLGLFC